MVKDCSHHYREATRTSFGICSEIQPSIMGSWPQTGLMASILQGLINYDRLDLTDPRHFAAENFDSAKCILVGMEDQYVPYKTACASRNDSEQNFRSGPKHCCRCGCRSPEVVVQQHTSRYG
jgi:hypothetical protein